jgi:hypothetical protein
MPSHGRSAKSLQRNRKQSQSKRTRKSPSGKRNAVNNRKHSNRSPSLVDPVPSSPAGITKPHCKFNGKHPSTHRWPCRHCGYKGNQTGNLSGSEKPYLGSRGSDAPKHEHPAKEPNTKSKTTITVTKTGALFADHFYNGAYDANHLPIQVAMNPLCEFVPLPSWSSTYELRKKHSTCNFLCFKNFITEDVFSDALKYFPQYKLIYKNPTENIHHDLALDRRLCEQSMYDRFNWDCPDGHFIYDWGGNAARHAKLKRTNVWSLSPNLTALDQYRHQFWTHDKYQYCDHTAEQFSDPSYHCDLCDQHPRTQPLILLTHSAYYWTKEELLIELAKVHARRCLVLVHKFPATDEFELKRIGSAYYNNFQHSVSMHTPGDSAVYTHSDLGWLRDASTATVTHNGRRRSFFWNCVQETSYSQIFEIIPIKVGTPPVTITPRLFYAKFDSERRTTQLSAVSKATLLWWGIRKIDQTAVLRCVQYYTQKCKEANITITSTDVLHNVCVGLAVSVPEKTEILKTYLTDVESAGFVNAYNSAIGMNTDTSRRRLFETTFGIEDRLRQAALSSRLMWTSFCSLIAYLLDGLPSLTKCTVFSMLMTLLSLFLILIAPLFHIANPPTQLPGGSLYDNGLFADTNSWTLEARAPVTSSARSSPGVSIPLHLELPTSTNQIYDDLDLTSLSDSERSHLRRLLVHGHGDEPNKVSDYLAAAGLAVSSWRDGFSNSITPLRHGMQTINRTILHYGCHYILNGSKLHIQPLWPCRPPSQYRVGEVLRLSGFVGACVFVFYFIIKTVRKFPFSFVVFIILILVFLALLMPVSANNGMVYVYDDACSIPSTCYGGRLVQNHREESALILPTDAMSFMDKCTDISRSSYTYGPSSAVVKPKIAYTCYHNELLAIANRALLDNSPWVRVHYSPTQWERFTAWTTSQFTNLFGDTTDLKPLDRCSFLSRYSGPRLQAFIDAFEVIDARGLSPELLDEFAELTAFVKRETIICHPDTTKDPRCIQSRTGVFNACYGPTVVAFSDFLKKIWSYHGPSTGRDDFFLPLLVYATGMNANELGDMYESFRDHMLTNFGPYTCFGNDFTRYDCHWTVEHFLFIHTIIDRIMALPKEFTLAFEHILHARGTSLKSRIRYTVDGTVHSGDFSTSVYNTLLTGLMHLFGYADAVREYDVKILTAHPFRAAVLGDDTHGISLPELCEKMAVNPMADQLGFHSTFVTGDETTIDFCSSVLVPVANGKRILTRLPGRILAKTWTCLIGLGGHKQYRYARIVAQGLLDDFRHVRWMYVLLNRVIELSEESFQFDIATGTPYKHISRLAYNVSKQKYRCHSAVSVQADDSTINFWCTRYNITAKEWLGLADWIDVNYTSMFSAFDHPVLNRIVAIDTGLDLTDLPSPEILCSGATAVPGRCP